mgnify:CR=1 FL=1
MRIIITKFRHIIKVALALLVGISIYSTNAWADPTLKVASVQLQTADAGYLLS